MSYESRFMCVCTPEGLKECREILAEVEALFKTDRDDIIDKDGHNLTEAHSDSGLISYAIYWANWQDRERYYEWGFAADQWAGVTCREYTVDPETNRFTEKPTDSIFFQCDVVEHGIAACIKYFNDKSKNNVEE